MHVALIMDGNGRWARARGLPRLAGHRAGARAVRRVVRAAPGLGIRTLTLFAFSADNWQRPTGEVDGLMRLFETYLRREVVQCRENGVRINVIGRRDRLPERVVAAIDAAERATEAGATLHLRIAVDYSAREALVRASALLPPAAPRARASWRARSPARSTPSPRSETSISWCGRAASSD